MQALREKVQSAKIIVGFSALVSMQNAYAEVMTQSNPETPFDRQPAIAAELKTVEKGVGHIRDIGLHRYCSDIDKACARLGFSEIDQREARTQELMERIENMNKEFIAGAKKHGGDQFFMSALREFINSVDKARNTLAAGYHDDDYRAPKDKKTSDQRKKEFAAYIERQKKLLGIIAKWVAIAGSEDNRGRYLPKE